MATFRGQDLTGWKRTSYTDPTKQSYQVFFNPNDPTKAFQITNQEQNSGAYATLMENLQEVQPDQATGLFEHATFENDYNPGDVAGRTGNIPGMWKKKFQDFQFGGGETTPSQTEIKAQQRAMGGSTPKPTRTYTLNGQTYTTTGAVPVGATVTDFGNEAENAYLDTSLQSKSPEQSVQTYTQPKTQMQQFALTGENLKQGTFNNANVRQLQTLLGISADGDFGPQTKAAVIAFQKANGLTPDGIVGRATTAKLNQVYAGKLTTPTTKPIDNTVPGASGILTLPKQDTTIADSYVTSLSQQLADAQLKLDNERKIQLERTQADKQAVQNEIDNALASQNTIILEEQRRKLEAYDTNMARYDKAYNEKRGFVSQLQALMTQGNNLINSQKSTTGLTAIRNPRVTETIANITAQSAILQAGIDASEFDMNSSNNIIQTAMSALSSIYENEINYYSTIAENANNKLIQLTADEKEFMDAKILELETQRDNIQKNVDYIQELMITPESASFMARAGISLMDSPAVINQKMAAQAEKDELSDAKNEMVKDGYTYVPFPKSTSGLVPITVGGQTLYFKPKPEKLTESEKSDAEINNIYNYFEDIAGGDGYVDPYIYRQKRAESKMTPSQFDDRFAHFVNPASYGVVGFESGEDLLGLTASKIYELQVLGVDIEAYKTDSEYREAVNSNLEE